MPISDRAERKYSASTPSGEVDASIPLGSHAENTGTTTQTIICSLLAQAHDAMTDMRSWLPQIVSFSQLREATSRSP